MTRYEEQRKYEAVGIEPNHSLAYNRAWVKQTLELLMKKHL